jgi:hypothetical protein
MYTKRRSTLSSTLLLRLYQNLPYHSLEHYKAALYKAKQAITLFRDLFYFIPAYLRVVPALSILSTALLG